MYDTDTTNALTNPFQISNNGGTDWTAMTGTFTNFARKITNGAGLSHTDVGLQQEILGTDEAATNYQITITFTGSAS